MLGLLLTVLAVLGAAGPQHAVAADADTITIGEPGHITVTAPRTVAPGEYAELRLAYTNTSNSLEESAPLTLTFAPSAAASVDLDGLTFLDGGEGHTYAVTGNSAAGTVNVDWRYFDEGASTTTTVYIPFKDTATGPVPLSASLTENLGTGTVVTPLGSLTINNTPAAADLSVALDASPKGLGVVYATFTATVTNHGPAATTAAAVRFTYPAGFTLPSATGCTVDSAARTVTCDLGPLASGASTTRTLGLHASLLTIGSHLTVTAARTTSTPADPTPANDTATTTCSALTGLLIRC
ncbi:hypothetical protein CP968_29370 [Streptomyces subrutilus]|uniref:DUF11 domain-containing protein n=1 Tax=Streptomyces subrutilus TaxID=36818 RepID=A0A5P2UWF9_9ACTN|nr:hypothetical protein CP968_29370 [Streptomyces subrutilus]